MCSVYSLPSPGDGARNAPAPYKSCMVKNILCRLVPERRPSASVSNTRTGRRGEVRVLGVDPGLPRRGGGDRAGGGGGGGGLAGGPPRPPPWGVGGGGGAAGARLQAHRLLRGAQRPR